MGVTRGCSKTGCGKPAVATLTYAYADRAAVLGPLATYAEPHTYDLCFDHAERLTAPRGWEVVRIAGEYSEPAREQDDLSALADAVRETSKRPRPRPSDAAQRGASSAADAAGDVRGQAAREAQSGVVESGRRGHLRVLRDN